MASNITPSGALPNDPTGLYILIASYTDVSYAGCGGFAGTHSITAGVAFAAITRQVCPGGTIPGSVGTPNNDCPFDFAISTATHEIGEATTFGWSAGGGGLPEPWDVCETGYSAEVEFSCGWSISGTCIENFNVPGTGQFIIQDVWSREGGGECVQGQAVQSDLTPCLHNADCTWSHVCKPDSLCAPASCSDGVENGYESDVDCGISCGSAIVCATGKKCVTGWDCASGVCAAGLCT